MNDVQGFNTIEHFISADGGVLLVDKPVEWSSFNVVRKIRGVLRVKKAGHAGTLDPLATGLLILCSMKMTKRIEVFQMLPKTYEGSMKFGAVTASYDAATPEQDQKPIPDLSITDFREAVRRYTGSIVQYPPMFSAVKIKGQRLYTLARKGIEVERKPREVQVTTFEILKYEPPELHFRVECSKGTYVRSLVHDLGQHLGCGAYLSALRRTAIGAFTVDEAWTVERVAQAAVLLPQTNTLPGGAS